MQTQNKSNFHTLFFESSRECFGGRNENGRSVRKKNKFFCSFFQFLDFSLPLLSFIDLIF